MEKSDDVNEVEVQTVKKCNEIKEIIERKRPQKRKPGFHEHMFAETNYYMKNGLRYVYPYKFTFTAHVKLRWMGLKVLDVFKKEFHMETVEYYENAIKNGKIKVNDKTVSKDYVLTGKDILQTGVHRHEPPVLNEAIDFVANNDDMVVINKPSSIPVHPCGRYRHNTIVFLLGKIHGLHSLHTIHRIDRLTSGILMFAKSPKKAREMEKAIKGRDVEKEYVARVVGEFPLDEMTVNEPILTVSHKVGVCRVHKEGKDCSTTFRRKSFNGKTSVVQCIPHTGRMHQIRVHLQWLGFPIVNDPIYNHASAWKDSKGKHGKDVDIEFVVSELIRTRKDTSDDYELNTNKDVASSKDNPSGAKKLKLDDQATTDENNQIKDTIKEKTELLNDVSPNIHLNELNESKRDDDINDVEEISININDCSKLNENIVNIKQQTNSTSNENQSTILTGSQNPKYNNEIVLNSIPDTEIINQSVICTTDTEIINQSVVCTTDSVIANAKMSPDIITPVSVNNESVNEKIVNTKSPTTVDSAVTENPITKDSAVNKDRVTYTSKDLGDAYYDADCTECKRRWMEPLPHELIMYLHARKYKGVGFEYETSFPAWAADDWNE